MYKYLGGRGGVSNLLTNVNKGEGVKTMSMLARGVEARYRKPQNFATKFVFQGAILLFSIIHSSGQCNQQGRIKLSFQ